MKKLLLVIIFSCLLPISFTSAEKWEFVGSWEYTNITNDTLESPLLFVDLDRLEVLEVNEQNQVTSFLFKIAIVEDNNIRYMIFHTKTDPNGSDYLKKVSIFSINKNTKGISKIQINENAKFHLIDDSKENKLYGKAYLLCVNELLQKGYSVK